MTLKDKILKFRYSLLQRHPFYGDIALQLEFCENKSIPTAATDGFKVMYNPAFLESMTDGERNFVLMHELMHILLMHCSRSEDADPQIWNVAADYVVNGFISSYSFQNAMRSSGIPFVKPDDALYLKKAMNQSTEDLYAQILHDNADRVKNGRLRVDSLRVRSSDGLSSDSMTEISVPRAESGEQGGDLIPGTLRPGEREAAETQLRQTIRQAVSGQKGRSASGSFLIPDSVFRLVEGKRLNWKSLLKNLLSDRQSEECSWTTPERKYIHMDLILPGHGESEAYLEEVWAFVDCSGSVGKDEMEQFLSQLYYILKEFHCTMNLAYWDTQVQDVYRRIPSEKKLFDCIPHHSGGTDINCVYTWLSANKIKPEVMLVLTDGYFGHLAAKNDTLRRKTIVVLSPNSAAIDNNIRNVGKPASL